MNLTELSKLAERMPANAPVLVVTDNKTVHSYRKELTDIPIGKSIHNVHPTPAEDLHAFLKRSADTEREYNGSFCFLLEGREYYVIPEKQPHAPVIRTVVFEAAQAVMEVNGRLQEAVEDTELVYLLTDGHQVEIKYKDTRIWFSEEDNREEDEKGPITPLVEHLYGAVLEIVEEAVDLHDALYNEKKRTSGI